MFSAWSMPRYYKQGTGLELGQLVCEEKTYLAQEYAVGRGPPFGEEMNTEAEESLLLEAITMKCLVKALQAGKDLACAVVICEVWKS
jgi:hypothetical protein